jgi:mono/diheme cytochrome c family protein
MPIDSVRALWQNVRNPADEFMRSSQNAVESFWAIRFLAPAAALFITTNLLASDDGEASFKAQVQPLVQQYCSDCHADGAKKGGVAFDELKTRDEILDPHLWFRVLNNIRAGIMPPPKKPQPTPDEKKQLEQWIKSAAFREDPQNPDPGRVTVRRLNRVEYRNTIRDLMGIDFDTEKQFPPDDSGHGFDNIGDVLTLSPMLLEKYMAAAKAVVTKAVPAEARVPAEKIIAGLDFAGMGANPPTGTNTSLTLSYYKTAVVTNTFHASHPGQFQVALDMAANERFVDNQFDYNKCHLALKVDGEEIFQQDYTREGNRPLHYDFKREWSAGDHLLTIEVTPLTPDQKQVRSLSLRIDSLTVRGPSDPQYWVKPANYARFFPHESLRDAVARRAYAREILESFIRRAYRHPVQAATVDRLVNLAEDTYTQKDKTFEAGISQAMVAVLASPRFLFREEGVESASPEQKFPALNEYALASRLSYFLWCSMPDEELLQLADKHLLRQNIGRQIQRMLADRKAEELVRNFVGQWLQVRDIDSTTIDARQVLGREDPVDPAAERQRARFRELIRKGQASLSPEEKKEMDLARDAFRKRFSKPPRAELNGELRRAFRQETEKTFEYVLREDRSLLELLNSDYTFLNEKLAHHYGLTNLNVVGDELRRVNLPAGSARGGVLTQGSVLAVTSNPTRTSPVKRGKFVLDNLLGSPPAPPPPDIPPLEDAAKGETNRIVTLRETLAIHREKALCAGCHNRMDPLGLALDNFNALGMWRDQERGQPIDAAGSLLSGESFTNIVELKRILVQNHATEFYRTITEKLLTYALGRGLEYYDMQTVDGIVERLEKSGGKPSVLLSGIIESAPFQKTRPSNFDAPLAKPAAPSASSQLRADAKTE